LLIRAPPGGKAESRRRGPFPGERPRLCLLRGAAALVPAYCAPLGRQREARGDAPATPRSAHRRQRRGANHRPSPAPGSETDLPSEPKGSPAMILEPFAEGVWLSFAPASFLGLRFTSTMTVLRLSDGGLLVHSPVALTPERRRAVDSLGPVRHLYAPNVYHHL